MIVFLLFIYICIVIGEPIIIKWGPSWSWSYGSWIYNYLYNQCILPLTFFWVWILPTSVMMIQNYVIKFVCVTNDHVYVTFVVIIYIYISTCRFFPHSWLITRFVTRVTRWVSLMEQELPTLPEHRSSTCF